MCLDLGMRSSAILPILIGSTIPLFAADPAVKPHRIVKHAFGPAPIARTVGGALIGQWNDTPSEWGQGMSGFGKRVASGFGKHLVKVGIQYPVAQFRHEALGYRRSGLEGFRPRLQYALVSVVITRKTTTGKKTLATGEIAGNMGSGLISRLWQPASVASIGSGFTSAGITFGADAAGNVVQEFWPEIRHPRRRQRVAAAAVKPSIKAKD